MKLEEANMYLKKIAKEYKTYGDLDNPEFEDTKKIAEAIETVLEALEDISKKNKKIKEEATIWLKAAKVEMQEYGDNHEKYWKMFYELINKIIFN